jgi:Bacteriocin-protection, YdeI or OmpD-Associated
VAVLRLAPARYYGDAVSGPRVPGGVVLICWVEDAKQVKTRERRIRRTQEELEDGMRRPCCWPGCAHRERNGK